MKTFEDKLMEIQTDMISICLEYSEGKTDKIYIYGILEKEIISFDSFFQINEKLYRTNELNDSFNLDNKIDTSSNRIAAMQEIGNNDLLKLEELFLEDEKEVPKEIKIEFDVKSNHMNSSFNYDSIYKDNPNITDDEKFIEWMKEVEESKK